MTYENQAGEEITDRTLYQKVVNPSWDVISRDDTGVVLEAGDGTREEWTRE